MVTFFDLNQASIDIKDGGAAGTTVATINTMTGVGEYQIDMPEPGIRCQDVSHVCLHRVRILEYFVYL